MATRNHLILAMLALMASPLKVVSEESLGAFTLTGNAYHLENAARVARGLGGWLDASKRLLVADVADPEAEGTDYEWVPHACPGNGGEVYALESRWWPLTFLKGDPDNDGKRVELEERAIVGPPCEVAHMVWQWKHTEETV